MAIERTPEDVAQFNKDMRRIHARRTKQWPCFLCERLYAELEAAETCEREHGEAHDGYCDCSDCASERARDAAEEADRG